jgi:hypothetical protein
MKSKSQVFMKVGITMGDANQGKTLTQQDIIQIIATAKAGATSALIGMQIFRSLGDNTIVAGDILRLALTTSNIAVGGLLAPALAAIQTVAKDNDRVTISNDREVETTLGGTRVRVKEELSFDVAASTDGLPALDNIQGLQVHKILWISIQKIELIQGQGRTSLRVTAAGTTKDISLG